MTTKVDMPAPLLRPKCLTARKLKVTVVPKRVGIKYFGMGSKLTYALNGLTAVDLCMTRGQTYTFQTPSKSDHPFYLSTDQKGGAGFPGLLAAPSKNGVLRFTPTAKTPDLIYYKCGAHEFMGGDIKVVDAVPEALRVKFPSSSYKVEPREHPTFGHVYFVQSHQGASVDDMGQLYRADGTLLQTFTWRPISKYVE